MVEQAPTPGRLHLSPLKPNFAYCIFISLHIKSVPYCPLGDHPWVCPHPNSLGMHSFLLPMLNLQINSELNSNSASVLEFFLTRPNTRLLSDTISNLLLNFCSPLTCRTLVQLFLLLSPTPTPPPSPLPFLFCLLLAPLLFPPSPLSSSSLSTSVVLATVLGNRTFHS